MPITIKDCEVFDCGTAIHARGVHSITVDGLKVRNTKTVFDLDQRVDLHAQRVSAQGAEIFLKIRPDIPAELTQAILTDVQHGKNAEEIVVKYQDPIAGYGIKLDTILKWGERVERGADLLGSLVRLFKE